MVSATESLATKIPMTRMRPASSPPGADEDSFSVAPTDVSDNHTITIVAPKRKTRLQKAVNKVMKTIKGQKKTSPPRPLYADVKI